MKTKRKAFTSDCASIGQIYTLLKMRTYIPGNSTARCWKHIWVFQKCFFCRECYQLFCTIVELSIEPPFDEHCQCSYPVQRMFKIFFLANFG